MPEQPHCPEEYTRLGGRQPGDRIIRCHLPAGHPGEHEEAETEVRWTSTHTEQPMPVPNHRASIQSLVRVDLEQREQVGIQRYGTPLQAGNGRDALRDAYEESLDLACYLRQAIEERRP